VCVCVCVCKCLLILSRTGLSAGGVGSKIAEFAEDRRGLRERIVKLSLVLIRSQEGGRGVTRRQGGGEFRELNGV